MKLSNKLKKEYKIRFKETKQFDENNYNLTKSNIPTKKGIVIHENNDWEIYNEYGKVGECINGNVKWAIAKITKIPKKWVIEKNENHPMWNNFKKWWNKHKSIPIMGRNKYYSNNKNSFFDRVDDLLEFSNHQYLTLNQWTNLFLNKSQKNKKITLTNGDWCIFEWHEFHPLIGQFKEFNGTFYIDYNGNKWINYWRLPNKIQNLINKEINIINNYSKYNS